MPTRKLWQGGGLYTRWVMVLFARGMPGFIASQIARINRNYLLVALALALVVAAMGWFGWTYISAVVLGPRMVSAQELASPQFQSDPSSYKSIIGVRGSQARPTFYSTRVRRGKGYGTLYCRLLKVGDAQLIVQEWARSNSYTPAGQLREVPADIAQYASYYQKAGAILPVLLDTREWKEQGWMLLICGSIAGAGTLALAGLLLWWSTHPERHPVRRAVLRLGDFEATAMQIDGEMQAEFQRFGPVHLGQTTLAYAPAFSFDIVRLENITGARTEWIRKGKSSALFLLLDTRDERKVKWQISRGYADALLESVCAAAHVEPSGQAALRTIELRIGRNSKT